MASVILYKVFWYHVWSIYEINSVKNMFVDARIVSFQESVRNLIGKN